MSRDSKSNHTSIYVDGEIHQNIFIFLTAKAVLEIAFTPPPPFSNSVQNFYKSVIFFGAITINF
jgi:hypothetical protein